jgi:Zn-dependent peptidase ImmA (M78 family)/DNA-binding XRE family transcriptional regulator
MVDKIIGNNLKRLRITKGLKQEDVARKLNITTAIYRNLESGKTQPKSEILNKAVDFFGVGLDNIITETKQLEFFRFRDHKKLKSRDQILFAIAKKLADYNDLEQALDISPANKWELGKLKGSPKELAIKVREKFKLNDKKTGVEKPVTNICGLLEEHGVRVIPLAVSSHDFFGLSVDEKDGGPCVVVNVWERIPVERWIFSAVHELGHLLQHKTSYHRSIDKLDAVGKKEEKEANEFASLVLIPDNLFKQEFEKVSGQTLIESTFRLKRFFNVSYKAILYKLSVMGWPTNIWREFQLEYRRVFKKFLPGNIEPEPLKANEFSFEMYSPFNVAHEPKRLEDIEFTANGKFSRMVKEALLMSTITQNKAAEMLGITLEELGNRVEVWKKQEEILK